MPATMGDAKDVPHHQVQRTGRVEPVIAQPGADTLVHDPRFDQLYRRLELFDAATLMTPGRTLASFAPAASRVVSSTLAGRIPTDALLGNAAADDGVGTGIARAPA